jgi:hypothetical protein
MRTSCTVLDGKPQERRNILRKLVVDGRTTLLSILKKYVFVD